MRSNESKLKYCLTKGKKERDIVISFLKTKQTQISNNDVKAHAYDKLIQKLSKCHEEVIKAVNIQTNIAHFRPKNACNLKNLCPICRQRNLNRHIFGMKDVITQNYHDSRQYFAYITFTAESNHDVGYASKLLDFQSWLSKKLNNKRPLDEALARRWDVINSTRLMVSKYEFTLNHKSKPTMMTSTPYNHHIHSTLIIDKKNGDTTWTHDEIESVIIDLYHEYSFKFLNDKKKKFIVHYKPILMDEVGFGYIANADKDLSEDFYHELNLESLVRFTLENPPNKRLFRKSFHKNLGSEVKSLRTPTPAKFAIDGIYHRDFFHSEKEDIENIVVPYASRSNNINQVRNRQQQMWYGRYFLD